MSKKRRIVITDNIKKSNIDQKCFQIFLNGFESEKNKNFFFIEKILFNNSKHYRDLLLMKIKNFLTKIKEESKNRFVLNNFNIVNLNSLLHPNVMQKESNHLCILKNLIIEDILKKKKIKKIFLSCSNKEITAFIKLYSQRKKIELEIDSNIEKKSNLLIKLKNILKTIKQIIYYFVNSKLLLDKKKIKNNIIFLGFLAHFKSKKDEKIKQDYWNNVGEFVNEKKINSSWFYFFYRTPILKKLKEAKKFITFQNNISSKYEKYYLIENFISINILISSLFDFIFIKIKSYNFKKKIIHLYEKNEFNCLIPSRDSFINSLCDFILFENIILLNTFNNLTSLIDNTNKVIYLMENQKWEKIFNFYCNEQKIKNFAYPHAGVMDMDLRFFLNSKKTLNKHYLPYKIISHSKDTNIWLKKINVNKNKIINLESLRFLKGKFKINKQKIINNKLSRKKKCLIFLDIYDQESSPILDIISKIVKEKKKILDDIYVKIHPTANEKFFKKKYPFAKIIKGLYIPEDISFIISGSITTASYFSIYNDLPLYVFLRPCYINMIPNFGKNKVIFFNDYKSFKKEIINFKKVIFVEKKFHNTNPLVPLWKKFLISLSK